MLYDSVHAEEADSPADSPSPSSPLPHDPRSPLGVLVEQDPKLIGVFVSQIPPADLRLLQEAARKLFVAKGWIGTPSEVPGVPPSGSLIEDDDGCVWLLGSAYDWR